MVDDEPLVRLLLQELVQDAGFAAIVAATYDEAIAAVQNRLGDLAGLVTDINLGEARTGWDVAAHACAMIPGLRVVYVTGDSGHEWPTRGAPDSILITKPFTDAEVMAALAGVMTRHPPA